MGSVFEEWRIRLKKGETIQIVTAEDFKHMTEMTWGKYEFMNDIDLSGINIKPEYYGSFGYAGTVNGNGFTIKNLTLDKVHTIGDHDQFSLFGKIFGADISNINFDNVKLNIKSNNKVDFGLIGNYCSELKCKNITLKGFHLPNANLHEVGGLFGWLDGGIAENCKVSMTVDDDLQDTSKLFTGYKGAIAGSTRFCKIRNCEAEVIQKNEIIHGFVDYFRCTLYKCKSNIDLYGQRDSGARIYE
jgi:hypothetical protein